MNIKLHNHVPRRSTSSSAQLSRLHRPTTFYPSGVENAVARQNTMSCVTSQIRNNLRGSLPIGSTNRKTPEGISIEQLSSNGQAPLLVKRYHSYTSGVVASKALTLPKLPSDWLTPNLLSSLV
jgi:hypothetical protein